MLNQHPYEHLDTRDMAKLGVDKSSKVEELLSEQATKTRENFEEIKRMFMTLTDAVLELHQKRLALADDVSRFQMMNALIAVGCGLFFGWTGALLFAVMHR